MTVMAYASPDISPSEFWISAFLPYTIPLLVLTHLAVAIYLLLAKKWLKSLIPLFFVIFGLSFLPKLISFHLSNEKKAGATFSVLSYNARVFNVYEIYNKNNPSISTNIINDAVTMEGDIKCFQEFYTEKQGKFNTIEKLSKTHPYYYFEPFLINHIGGGFGMAIFSKYPIEKKENIQFKEKSNNQILYTDILIGRNKVRVFNVHLQSMNINDEELAESRRSQNRFKQNMLKALLRYKQGAIRRSKQVDRLIMEINRSPYPVMVCGDFNEPPLGYAYKQVSNLLSNSQEEAGHGIGTTHNGKIPFLRIDNQFYQEGILIHSFDVLNDKKLSDHYPLLGYYSFK